MQSVQNQVKKDVSQHCPTERFENSFPVSLPQTKWSTSSDTDCLCSLHQPGCLYKQCQHAQRSLGMYHSFAFSLPEVPASQIKGKSSRQPALSIDSPGTWSSKIFQLTEAASEEYKKQLSYQVRHHNGQFSLS